MTSVGSKVIETPTLGLRGLRLWLSFNEGSGSTAYDSSFYNNHGTIVGAVWTDGKFGTALYYDGVDDYVDCGNSYSLNHFESLTLAVMAKQTGWTYGADAWVVDKDYTGYRLWGKDRFIFAIRSPSQDWVWCDAGPVPQLNTWYFVVGVYDADALKIRIYVNGELKAECDVPEKINFDYVGWSHLRLGRHSSADNYYPIVIDDFKLYVRALSENEVKMLMYNRIGAVPSKTI